MIFSGHPVLANACPCWPAHGCNNGEMILPGVTSNKGCVQVEKVLHNSLCICGQALQVVSVCLPNTSNNPMVSPAKITSFRGL
jgi:hypothetical protein